MELSKTQIMVANSLRAGVENLHRETQEAFKMKKKVKSLLAVQNSIEWDHVFEQATGVASPKQASGQ